MDKAILNVTDAAYYLNTTEDALHQAKRQGVVPYRRQGRKIIFVKADLDAWLSLLPGVSVAEAITRVKASTSLEMHERVPVDVPREAPPTEAPIRLTRGPQGKRLLPLTTSAVQ